MEVRTSIIHYIPPICIGVITPCPNTGVGFANFVSQRGSRRLTHWGRVTHICVDKLTIIGSDNGFSPGRRQAIIWTNAVILLIGFLGTNFSEISIGIQTFSFKKMYLKMSSVKWRSFCLGLKVLNHYNTSSPWPTLGLVNSCTISQVTTIDLKIVELICKWVD